MPLRPNMAQGYATWPKAHKFLMKTGGPEPNPKQVKSRTIPEPKNLLSPHNTYARHTWLVRPVRATYYRVHPTY